ncbi:MAG: hypothetical protein AAFR81_02410 [Chloroflexota bacterium]
MNHRDTEKIEENIFGLDDAEELKCNIMYYNMSQRTMRVMVKNTATLEFRGVEYYAGPTYWIGANFRLHPRSACLAMIQNYLPKLAMLIDEFPEPNLDKFFMWKLISVPIIGKNVEIIATNVLSLSR